jgi:hypothetical protein
VVLVAVGVAAVDHDLWLDAGFFHLLAGGLDGGGVVVGGVASAAKDDVAVAVALGDEDGGLPVLRVAEEVVGLAGGEDGFDGDLDVAGGSVFEADGTGDAGDEFAVDLAFGGAGPDGSPADERGDVLRGDHVEELCAGGYAHLGEVEEKVAGFAEAVVDLEGFVEVGVVDEALPAECGAGFFEVDAHDEAEFLGELCDGAFEELGVFAGGVGVVDRAGADDDDEAIVFAVEDVDDLGAGLEDGGGGGFGDGEFFFKKNRREDDFGPGYAKVISGKEHRSHFSTESDDTAEWPGILGLYASFYLIACGGWVSSAMRACIDTAQRLECEVAVCSKKGFIREGIS